MEIFLSRSRIDKLGERLRESETSADDLRLLDAYRRTFVGPYEHVVGTIRRHLGLEPTGREAKSTQAIRAKLLRESIRLSQIQDIAGCRIIADNIAAQNAVIERIMTTFPNATIIDRRINPSHGYRAVHVIVENGGKLIEVQCRTALQHLWAQFSESITDAFDLALKYGGGPDDWRLMLDRSSRMTAAIEDTEAWQNSSARLDYDASREELKAFFLECIEWASKFKG